MGYCEEAKAVFSVLRKQSSLVLHTHNRLLHKKKYEKLLEQNTQECDEKHKGE